MEMVCSSASASKRHTTSFHSEKMTLEDYLLLIQSNSHLHLTVAYLNQEFFKCLSPVIRMMNIPRPYIHQGGSSGKLGYFKASHVKINSNELFWNFFETYTHTILPGVRMR